MKSKNLGTLLPIIIFVLALAVIAAVYYFPSIGNQSTTTIPHGSSSSYYAGQKASNFLIVQINRNNVTGLSYTLYPSARLNGTQTTLYVGNTVGYDCDGSLKVLTSINSNSVTFTNISTGPRYGGCPV